jgi:hypothetical protein
MISDQQVRRLRKLMQEEKTQAVGAAKAGMDVKTARKYARSGRLPSELQVVHNWRTRPDPFNGVRDEVKKMLEDNPGLEAKTIFEELQRLHPGTFSDGQLRTLQRSVKQWRALEGPQQEVFFAQEHKPGILCESDFTHMEDLKVTIGRGRFDHLIYHMVLPYSNWETGSICFSESFESLSEGFQNALWELGGVVTGHKTDRLTAAVHKAGNPEEFTTRYNALLRHYDMEGKKTNPNSPNENGDVEQSHYRFKQAVEQRLLLRGNRDFAERKDYEMFLRTLFQQRNSGRKKRFAEEVALLRSLPRQRLDARKRETVKVGPSSTIRISHNTYSVNSRLIGERVDVHLYADRVDVFYAQRCVDSFPRLRGDNGHKIEYRHIIDWLVRKPGAFENYRYREDLFPTHRFRVAYDQLREQSPLQATKHYLAILLMASEEGEMLVDNALGTLITSERDITKQTVKDELLAARENPKTTCEVNIMPVNLLLYDSLLSSCQVSS